MLVFGGLKEVKGDEGFIGCGGSFDVEPPLEMNLFSTARFAG